MQKLTFALFLVFTACSKAPSAGDPAAAPSGSAPAASLPPSNASAAATPTVAATDWYVGAWKGEYSATKRASTTKTKEGGPAAWEKDDGQKLSGPGTIELAITDQGDVTGTLKGGLGELALRGKVEGEQLRANVVSASDDPTAIHNGYLVLARDAGTFKGRLLAGSGDALTMRQADVTLKKAAP